MRTRILYHRTPTLELFLIDSPPEAPPYHNTSDLRRGFRFEAHGECRPLQVPLNFERPTPEATDQPDSQDSIVKFANDLDQRELRHALLASSIPDERKCGWLARFWSMHAWQRSLGFLDREIQRISFVEMRQPDEDTSNSLHSVREYLSRLVAAVHHGWKLERTTSGTVNEIRDRRAIKDALHPDKIQMFGSLLHGEGSNEFEVFLQEIARQQDIVVQSFQILLSSIGIKESQAAGDESRRSMEQARKSTVLTGVALIYAALSFVTGIFGMNLKEINGASPAFWSVIAALVVILIITSAVFNFYMTWSQRRAFRSSDSGLNSRGLENLPRDWNHRRPSILTQARVAMWWLRDLKRKRRRHRPKRDNRDYSVDLNSLNLSVPRARTARSDSEHRSEHSISSQNIDYDIRNDDREPARARSRLAGNAV